MAAWSTASTEFGLRQHVRDASAAVVDLTSVLQSGPVLIARAKHEPECSCRRARHPTSIGQRAVRGEPGRAGGRIVRIGAMHEPPGFDVAQGDGVAGRAHLADLAPPLRWTKLAGGHSNFTYRVDDAGRPHLRHAPAAAR